MIVRHSLSARRNASRTIAPVHEVTGSPTSAPVGVHYSRWFGGLAVVIAATLAMLRQWPVAAGVLLASAGLLWVTRRAQRGLSRPRAGAERPKGLLIFAGIEAAVGAVILFVGALVGGGIIDFVTVAFGTWMIGIAVLIAGLYLSGRP